MRAAAVFEQGDIVVVAAGGGARHKIIEIAQHIRLGDCALRDGDDQLANMANGL